MRFRLQLSLIAALACAAVLSRAAVGDEEGDPKAPRLLELNVSAAAEPRPALKYRLLPAPNERKPGNAATQYYRAIMLQRNLPKEYWQEHSDNYEAWNESPPASFPKEQAAKWLSRQHSVLTELKFATHREHCDWDLRIQDLKGPEVFSFLIPEIQECRELSRTLRLKARYEIIDGRPDDAFETLQQGYQLARDAARPPFLVCGLVGIAITNTMNEELRHLIATSNGNYYWAIASLPQPLVDLRPALEFEMDSAFQVFPFLQDAETAERTPDEWRKLMVEAVRGLAEFGGNRELQNWQSELAAVGMLTKLYPVAKQELLASNMDPQRVERMPVGQVVAIHTARVTEYAYHELFKISLLPYHEAARRLPQTMKNLEKDVLRRDAALSGRSGLPIASLLLPAIQNLVHAQVRPARDFASLQTIEALRMHAAASGGKLPSSLADVKIVPVPNDPASGEPFPYKYDAATGTATLEAPPLTGWPASVDARRYVIRLK